MYIRLLKILEVFLYTLPINFTIHSFIIQITSPLKPIMHITNK